MQFTAASIFWIYVFECHFSCIKTGLKIKCGTCLRCKLLFCDVHNLRYLNISRISKWFKGSLSTPFGEVGRSVRWQLKQCCFMHALYNKVQMWQGNKMKVVFSDSKYFLSHCKFSCCALVLSNLEWEIYTCTFTTVVLLVFGESFLSFYE